VRDQERNPRSDDFLATRSEFNTMDCMNPNTVDDILERLKTKRARGRWEKIEIGVRLGALKKQGIITDAQFNYVMGIERVAESKRVESSAMNSVSAGDASDEPRDGN
jgi:hypothetical protein